MLLLLEDRRGTLRTLGITRRTKRHKHHPCELLVGRGGTSPEMWGNLAHVPAPIMLPCCGHNWRELLGLWARLLSPSPVPGLQSKHVRGTATLQTRFGKQQSRGASGNQGSSWGGEDEGEDWCSRGGAVLTPCMASELLHL